MDTLRAASRVCHTASVPFPSTHVFLHYHVKLFVILLCVLSCVWLFAAPWSIAGQAPLSVGFLRQESWSGLPFPSPGDLPDQGANSRPLHLLPCRRILDHWATRETLLCSYSALKSTPEVANRLQNFKLIWIKISWNVLQQLLCICYWKPAGLP